LADGFNCPRDSLPDREGAGLPFKLIPATDAIDRIVIDAAAVKRTLPVVGFS
jgi:hypothetical protein